MITSDKINSKKKMLMYSLEYFNKCNITDKLFKKK